MQQTIHVEGDGDARKKVASEKKRKKKGCPLLKKLSSTNHVRICRKFPLKCYYPQTMTERFCLGSLALLAA